MSVGASSSHDDYGGIHLGSCGPDDLTWGSNVIDLEDTTLLSQALEKIQLETRSQGSSDHSIDYVSNHSANGSGSEPDLHEPQPQQESSSEFGFAGTYVLAPEHKLQVQTGKSWTFTPNVDAHVFVPPSTPTSLSM